MKKNKNQDSDVQDDLLRAISARHIEGVMHALKEGADPNKKQGDSVPLKLALQHGDLEVLQMLVDAGADVHYRIEPMRVTLLQYAMGTPQTQGAEFLIAQGLSLEDTDILGRTALFHAARSRQTHMIEYLIEKKVDLNHQTLNGHTALHFLLTDGAFVLASKLCEAGANPNLKNDEGVTAMEHGFAHLARHPSLERVKSRRHEKLEEMPILWERFELAQSLSSTSRIKEAVLQVESEKVGSLIHSKGDKPPKKAIRI